MTLKNSVDIKDGYKINEKKIYDIFLKKGYIKEGKKLNITHIKNNVYSLSNKNINGYTNENGEIIFFLEDIAKDDYFNKSAYLAGFREIKDNNGIYNLYRLNDIDKNSKNGEPKKGAKPVDKYSYEYYKAWLDIYFYEAKLWLETFKIEDKGGGYSKMSDNNIERKIKTGSVRIVDMLDLAKPEKQVISKEQFKKYLPQLQAILLDQIGDPRFERLGDSINIKELNFYRDNKLISESLYNQAKKKLEEVEKVKSNKLKQKYQIHSQAHYGVENEVMVG